ncbi:hypothetical protein BDZ94DRAFT_1237670 [Collybia nuda]|uniref:DUF6533 domain-containing protein n=1 Tax=Collybia nuda TaxID=64659 RepID=A0A9P5Y2C1_9AGAR|nr:hypothetical protein BDZ94DRAFT_1237670 [Collybia nuda]
MFHLSGLTIYTLNLEVRYIWKSKNIIGKAVFFLNRYPPILALVLGLYYSLVTNVFPEDCSFLSTVGTCSTLFLMLTSENQPPPFPGLHGCYGKDINGMLFIPLVFLLVHETRWNNLFCTNLYHYVRFYHNGESYLRVYIPFPEFSIFGVVASNTILHLQDVAMVQAGNSTQISRSIMFRAVELESL